MTMKKYGLGFILLFGFLAQNSWARDYIDIVGSSTVFPFATVVAETFGKKTRMPTPKIESTGSGGGMKLFCQGIGVDTPDITNASRRIKAQELQNCHENGVTDITEVLVGFDGIAFANAKNAPDFDLSLRDIYLALAAEIPASMTNQNGDGLVENPFTHWHQINQNLPAVRIRVLGPPPTSGTRDALSELAIEGGCKTFPEIAAIKSRDKTRYKKLCHTVREDGVYVEMGENDNLIISKLRNDPDALGVFGFSFLEQNRDQVKGAKVGGHKIEFDNIASGAYPVSRPLYFYIKNAHRGRIPGMDAFIREFVDEDTIGDDGYLVDKGLIPAPLKKRHGFAHDAQNSINLEL